MDRRMSGGHKYVNINVSNLGQTRITPVAMNKTIIQSNAQMHNHHHHHQQQQQQQQHPQIIYSQQQSQQPQQQRRIVVQQGTIRASSPAKMYLKQLGGKPVVVDPNSITVPLHAPEVKNVKTTQRQAKQSAAAKAGPSSSSSKSTVEPKSRRGSRTAPGAGGKPNKGLRHFSMKVCEKVKEKGTTTYNEVADELVEDEMKRAEAGERTFDQKNIRRRVYDALNVLMAMNIISKEKKSITWLGLPNNTPAHSETMERDLAEKRKAIAAKEKELKDLLLLQVSLKNLVNRNRDSEELGYIPTPNSHIQLPFIVVNTHRDTRIHCTISQDKTEYFFKFDDKFELNDHVTVLQRMGLLMGLDTGTSSEEDIHKLKQLVPVEFQSLIENYARGKDTVEVPDEEQVEEEDEDGDVEHVVDEEEEVEGSEMDMVEYVDMSNVVGHEIIEEEYSEDDTIIEEPY